MKWILMLCLGLFGLQTTLVNAAQDALAEANAARKEQLLLGGKMSPKQRAELNKADIAEKNSLTTDDFLASNRLKPGVISLPSGVQYKVLKAGAGKKPIENSQIRSRYQGALTDGSTFDKIEDKTPAYIQVSGLLPGLKEAVKLMPVGSKWEVVIPPQLGYGTQGNHAVGANAVLIYVIEILSIK